MLQTDFTNSHLSNHDSCDDDDGTSSRDSRNISASQNCVKKAFWYRCVETSEEIPTQVSTVKCIISTEAFFFSRGSVSRLHDHCRSVLTMLLMFRTIEMYVPQGTS